MNAKKKIWYTKNKDKTKKYSRKSYVKNKERWTFRRIERTYGISKERYMEILRSQGGGCAVCKKSGITLHVDHDHNCCPSNRSCGKCVRGLLCVNHNAMLGMSGDSPEALIAGAEYIKNARVSIFEALKQNK